MNFKQITFSIIFIATFSIAATADEPVGEFNLKALISQVIQSRHLIKLWKQDQ